MRSTQVIKSAIQHPLAKIGQKISPEKGCEIGQKKGANLEASP